MKALMKYPGSKWGSADWIISHFPEHHSYLEPFFGSGGVFFNKPRSDIETINDLDGEVVNLSEKIMEAAERLRGVQIENRPAVEVIRKFNFENVLIYCDPPYVLSTRCRKQYRYEMTDEDHEVLLEALLQHKGPAIISGYSSPLYEERLKDWYREERINYAQNAQQRREVIWCNQKTEKTAQQLTLF